MWKGLCLLKEKQQGPGTSEGALDFVPLFNPLYSLL